MISQSTKKILAQMFILIKIVKKNAQTVKHL